MENTKEYVKNTKKYVENMKEYVDILDLVLPYLYGPWDLEKFRALPSYSLWDWKNSEFSPFIWALEWKIAKQDGHVAESARFVIY